MQWRPTDFWAATIGEFFDAIEVFNEMHGGPAQPETPTEDELAELLEKYG